MLPSQRKAELASVVADAEWQFKLPFNTPYSAFLLVCKDWQPGLSCEKNGFLSPHSIFPQGASILSGHVHPLV